jgi:hypothetical protein
VVPTSVAVDLVTSVDWGAGIGVRAPKAACGRPCMLSRRGLPVITAVFIRNVRGLAKSGEAHGVVTSLCTRGLARAAEDRGGFQARTTGEH